MTAPTFVDGEGIHPTPTLFEARPGVQALTASIAPLFHAIRLADPGLSKCRLRQWITWPSIALCDWRLGGTLLYVYRHAPVPRDHSLHPLPNVILASTLPFTQKGHCTTCDTWPPRWC